VALSSLVEISIMNDMFYGASARIFSRARKLRHNQTLPEKILWSRLSRNQLGVKFRRQHPMLRYVVDFYCHSHNLIVEVDGEVHLLDDSRTRDKLRTEEIVENGLRLIRFTNEDIFQRLDWVVAEIKSTLSQVQSSSNSSKPPRLG